MDVAMLAFIRKGGRFARRIRGPRQRGFHCGDTGPQSPTQPSDLETDRGVNIAVIVVRSRSRTLGRSVPEGSFTSAPDNSFTRVLSFRYS